MSDNVTEDMKKLPTEEELKKLSEKERKSFFRNLFKKLNEQAEKENAKSDDVLAEMMKDKNFPMLEKLLPRMEKLLAAFPELEALEEKERYQMAYFVVMGADAVKKAEKKPTARELVDMLLANEEAVRLYENLRTSEIAVKNRDYPAHSASKGAASMPATVKNAPKDLNEARKEAYGYFGINN